MIYHYTTQAGLIGILTAREIWATDLRFFNDSTELHYALGIAEQKIRELEQCRDSVPGLALLMDVRRRLEQKIAAEFESGPYVACLKTEPID